MAPEVEKVRERIDTSRSYVRIVGEVVGGVETDRRIAALVPAHRVIMIERIDPRRRDIRIGREIALGIEQCVRIAAFLPADRLEVLERIDVSGGDVRVLLEIIDVVEAGRARRCGAARER
jgi:hypothetical protein